ncbi:MAG: TIGR02221 family CRISPR-associated protein [Tannerella forsythia]|jgi:CRISPR-associated protein, TM1812 family|uniref:TIGR02221 family CRISPR-associated protein n=1 Tax=Tannerella forsythia TaxID=28112 RepID=UPI003607B865
MGRKVLISFIGTGPVDNKNNSGKRVYKTARYRFEEKEIETSFVSIALGEFLNIDTFYLFGTMKSMWEEVYLKFATQNKKEIDDNYWLQISEQCVENANHTSKIDNVSFDKIAQIIGNDSKIFPIYYGLNQLEIEKNFSIFVEAMDYLRDGDEIFLDITHSFRSLPLFATTALSFIKDVANKKIHLSGIYYGMLEAGREFDNNIVPVVDLSYISELQNWIKGAHSFYHFGNGRLLAELLKEKDKTQSEKLIQFTNVLSMNFIHEIKSQINLLTSLASKDKEYALPEKLILPEAFKSFTKRFSRLNRLSEYQFELSIWHKDNSNFALSYLCLVEAILSFVCEQEKFNATAKDKRDEAKKLILKDGRYSEINPIYTKANGYRKNSAHLVGDITSKANEAVKKLNDFHSDFKKILYAH